MLIKQTNQDHEIEKDNLNRDKVKLQNNIQQLEKRINVLEETLSSAPSPQDMENVQTALINSESNLRALKVAFQNQIENGNQEKLEQACHSYYLLYFFVKSKSGVSCHYFSVVV